MSRVSIACVVLAASLIGVGLASGTLLRHLIQIAPILAAAALALWRSRLGAAAAVPIFVVWIAIPVMIWMFLLHIATFVRGTFTPVEVFLTVVMAASSITGGVAAVRSLRGARLAASAALVLLFGALQLEAMRISFRPSFAHDR